MIINEATKKVVLNEDISEGMMIDIMNEIMEGKVEPMIMASFLTGLKMKGETSEEIAGAAKVMREKAVKVALDEYDTIDTCGTGGDGSGTFNISTGVAFVLAAAGLKVVKHGNRSISSKCGSADVLEALNVNINLDKDQVRNCVIEENIGFLFAPNHHKAMKYAMPVRKTLGFRTIFNVLGPLSNPASAKCQLIGVYDESLTEVMAEALKLLGTKRALVVHGNDGLDEITTTTTTKVTELIDDNIRTYTLNPLELGIDYSTASDLEGGTKEENAELLIELFQGEKGPKRDILVLNSGAALFVANKVDSIAEGIEMAKELIDSKAVYNKLQSFVKYTEVIA